MSDTWERSAHGIEAYVAAEAGPPLRGSCICKQMRRFEGTERFGGQYGTVQSGSTLVPRHAPHLLSLRSLAVLVNHVPRQRIRAALPCIVVRVFLNGPANTMF